jgi:hypothetical protein
MLWPRSQRGERVVFEMLLQAATAREAGTSRGCVGAGFDWLPNCWIWDRSQRKAVPRELAMLSNCELCVDVANVEA